MKCPKCSYLGFETGNRCKNCGYDFSLLAVAESEPDFDQGASVPDADYPLHTAPGYELSIDVMDDLDRTDLPVDTRLHSRHLYGRLPGPDDAGGDRLTMAPTPESGVADGPVIRLHPEVGNGDEIVSRSQADRSPVPLVPPVSTAPHAALPLFNRSRDEDDEPLVRMPAVPRAPLAVRRTPDASRARQVSRTMTPPSPPLALQFSDEGAGQRPRADQTPTGAAGVPGFAATNDPIGATARLVAVLIDHAILIGIDAAVVYFTVRMAGLSMSEWNLLPIAPMLMFLGLLKLSYFYGFTALGGQTIGKMAMGACVIADTGDTIDATLAMRRTCGGVLSVLLLGLGFVPALFGNRRALHDRLAGTRVVRLRPV